MPFWYFSKAELANTPSHRDGIEPEREARYRREGARFLIDCGNTMGLRYDTMATGVVFFHRFYMFHSFNEFPRYITAACCLFLAGKVEETPKKCRDIVRAAKLYLESLANQESKPMPERQYLKKHAESFNEETIRDIMTYEKIMLQTIKFDLQVDHPYGYLVKYAKTLKGNQEQIHSLVQMTWGFINDSYSTTLCLQWEPEIVAIALMYLTSKLSKFEIKDWANKKEGSGKQDWWDQFVDGLHIDILEDICHQLLDLYVKQPGSSSPSKPIVGQNGTTVSTAQPSLANKRVILKYFKQGPVRQFFSKLNKIFCFSFYFIFCLWVRIGPSHLIDKNINRPEFKKSPPDSSLTPTLPSVGYTEPTSPTSAKLMKTLSEPSAQYPGHQMSQSYYHEYQQQYHSYSHPPPPPPPPASQPPYPNYAYYPSPGNPPMPVMPQQFSYSAQQSTKPYNVHHQYSMAPGAPAADLLNHSYHHVHHNGPKEQSHVNINNKMYNSTFISSSNSNNTSSSQVRSSALKTVNITDRPV